MPESNQGRNLLFSSFFVLEVEKKSLLSYVVGFFVIQLVASTTCPVRLWRLTIRRDWWQSAAMAQVATVLLLLYPCPYRRLQQQWETSTTFRSRPLACQIKVTITAVAATICRIDPAASRSSRPAAAVPTALRPFPTLIDPSAQSRSRCPAPWVAFLAAPAAPASSISSNNRSNSMTSQRPTIR